jgi:N-methylhydantoinase A
VPDAGGSNGGPRRSPAPFDAALAEAVASAFHDAHRALYGYDFRGDARQHVEWVNLRVTGVGPIARPALVRIEPGDGNPARARTGSRPVCFGRGEEFVLAAIFARAGLMAGDVIAGPAVIEEYGATVPLHPGFSAVVDEQGNLRISRERVAA